MVYFIQQGSDGPIKIGHTENIVKRFLSLQGHSGIKIYLLGTIDADEKEEAVLHRKFRRFNIHGEWFKPDKEILSYIGSNTDSDLIELFGDVEIINSNIHGRRKKGCTVFRQQMTVIEDKVDEKFNHHNSSGPRVWPCVWCGQPLQGKQRRYHSKCRKAADKARRDAGFETINDPKICALPGCFNRVKRRFCCNAHRQKAYRFRYERNGFSVINGIIKKKAA